MKIVILLTSMVRPQVMGANFSVPERMEMYRSTLQYYAKTIGKDYPIVLVENSDADLSGWQEEFKDSLQLEILQFTPPQLLHSENNEEAHLQKETTETEDFGFDNRKGKGYNEYLMIKLALQRSQTLQSCSHFLKITGRYPMLNIKEMLGEMEKRGRDKVMMCDVKEFKLYEKLRGTSYGSRWGDSRYFLMSVDFYKHHLMDCYREMDDRNYGKYAEDYIYQLSCQYRYDSRCIFRFRHQVQFGGQNGDAVFDEHFDTFKNRMKNKLRRMLRVLFPNVWF